MFHMVKLPNSQVMTVLLLAKLKEFTDLLELSILQANPPQLHSNLKFIQLYRRQMALVSESAYYFTNLISAKTFILDLNAKSLSIDETKFEESMKAAKLAKKASQPESSLEPYYSTASAELRGLSPVAILNNDETSTSGKLDTIKVSYLYVTSHILGF